MSKTEKTLIPMAEATENIPLKKLTGKQALFLRHLLGACREFCPYQASKICSLKIHHDFSGNLRPRKVNKTDSD